MHGTWCKTRFISEKLTVKTWDNGRQHFVELNCSILFYQIVSCWLDASSALTLVGPFCISLTYFHAWLISCLCPEYMHINSSCSSNELRVPYNLLHWFTKFCSDSKPMFCDFLTAYAAIVFRLAWVPMNISRT